MDWQRAAEEIRRRRVALGLSQKATEGVSPATWTKLENARQQSYKPFLLANVERVLQWPPGTIERIASGQDLPEGDPLPIAMSLDQRVSRLEARLEQLERRLSRRTRERRAGGDRRQSRL